jgi:hypothetical protein
VIDPILRETRARFLYRVDVAKSGVPEQLFPDWPELEPESLSHYRRRAERALEDPGEPE